MPHPPEPREIAGQIGVSDPDVDECGPSRAGTFDAGREHARRLLLACDMEPAPLPDAAHPAREAAREWARSGAMMLTGHAEGPPRFAAGPLASAARGAALALRSLAGESALDTLDAPALLGERAALSGLTRHGDRSASGSARLLPACDGTLVLNLPRDDDWHLIPAWLEADLPLEPGHEPGERDAAWQRVAALVSNRASEPLTERGRLMGLAIATANATPAPPPHEPFFEVQHGTESPLGRGARRARLLDLSTLWAGPLATSLLSLAGIEVLKIESPTRPDGAREGPTAFFDLMNGGKRACALDLRDSHDRGLFERLLESADIVVESARPRALSQLGYDAGGWVGERVGRIWASITGYGRAHEWIAFGDDAALSAGLAWSPDAGQPDPCFCADAIADPLTGLHAAAIILAFMRRGRGGLLDLSLSGIARRAVSAEQEGLALPVEQGAKGWHVLADDRALRIEEPRARPILRPAPALAPASERLLSTWFEATC